MGKTLLLLCLLPLVALSNPIKLTDGEMLRGELKSESGGSLLYQFHTGHFVKYKDLIVSLTPYSDFADPEVYMAKYQDVSKDRYEYPKEPTSRGFTVIDSEVSDDTEYFILVTCESSCHYALAVAHLNPIGLTQGTTLNGDLIRGREAVYSVLVDPEGTEEIVVSVTPTSIHMKVKAELFRGNNTSGDSLPCTPAWHAGIVCLADKPDETEYRVVVTTNTTSSYTIVPPT